MAPIPDSHFILTPTCICLCAIAVVHAFMLVWTHDCQCPYFNAWMEVAAARNRPRDGYGSRGNPHFVESIRLPTSALQRPSHGPLASSPQNYITQQTIRRDVPYHQGSRSRRVWPALAFLSRCPLGFESLTALCFALRSSSSRS